MYSISRDIIYCIELYCIVRRLRNVAFSKAAISNRTILATIVPMQVAAPGAWEDYAVPDADGEDLWFPHLGSRI